MALVSTTCQFFISLIGASLSCPQYNALGVHVVRNEEVSRTSPSVVNADHCRLTKPSVSETHVNVKSLLTHPPFVMWYMVYMCLVADRGGGVARIKHFPAVLYWLESLKGTAAAGYGRVGFCGSEGLGLTTFFPLRRRSPMLTEFN